MYKVITKTLPDDAILWRYMDLSKYLSFLSDKSLWLARSDTFLDNLALAILPQQPTA